MDTKRRKTMFVRAMYIMVMVAVVFSMAGSAFAEGGIPTGYHDGMEGVVDAAGCTAFGWVADPDYPGRDLQLKIFADGNLVATTVADLFRPDVGECLDGTCGFNVNLWGLISAGVEHQITVQAYDVENQTWVNLSSTPKSLTCWGYPEGSHDGGEGIVDPYSCNASGWAADPDDRDRKLQVQILADGIWAAETTAKLLRPDVGACTGGTCGFYVDLWGLISPDVEHQITVEAYDVETDSWYSLGASGKLITCQTPPPWLIAFPENDAVEGWEWPEGATVTLTVNNAPTNFAPTGVAQVTTWGDPRTYFRIDFADDYDLQIDDVVTLTDGTKMITHVVQNLSVTGVDEFEETVAGTADAGAVVQVWPHGTGQQLQAIADDLGIWQVDFTDLFDLVMGTGGRSQIVVGGNATAVDWEVPPPAPVPFIWADPLCECINGWDWNVGDMITIRVFDQDNNELGLQNPTRIYEEGSGAAFELWPEGIDLQTGYRITMTNGLITKELIISKLVVKEMNPVANTLSGIYDQALSLGIHIGDQEALILEFEEDRWVATFDVSIDAYGEVYQPDEDGDKTGMGWDGVPRFMRYDIYAFDVESVTNERITTLDGTGEYDPSWSPFGKKVAHDVVYWDGSQAIYITDVATGSSHPLKGAVDGGNDAAWSPTGLWIAFDRRWTGDQSIYVVPFIGGQRRLVRENGVSPNWSPNGLRIVFQDLADGGKVKTVGLLGNLVITVADYGENPAWSPDGKWIAYSRDGDIWKVRVSPLGKPYGDPILVTDMTAWIGLPTWSDDSATIAFDAGMIDDWDLWSVPAAGGEPTWLTGVPEYGDYGPDYWKNFIAYASYSP